SNDVHHRDATLSQTFSEQKSEAREKYCSTKLSDRPGPKVWEMRIIGKGGNNEDIDNDSDIGVTADGVRPDSGATTDADAGAVERVLRPTIRGEPFPVDRQLVLRVRGWLLGRGRRGRLHVYGAGDLRRRSGLY